MIDVIATSIDPKFVFVLSSGSVFEGAGPSGTESLRVSGCLLFFIPWELMSELEP